MVFGDNCIIVCMVWWWLHSCICMVWRIVYEHMYWVKSYVHAFIVEETDGCPKCKAGVNLTLDVFVASEVTTLRRLGTTCI